MAIGNMPPKNLENTETWTGSSEDMDGTTDGWKDGRTDRHAHHNNPLPQPRVEEQTTTQKLIQLMHRHDYMVIILNIIIKTIIITSCD